MSQGIGGPLFVQLDAGGAERLQVQLYASIRRAILDGVLAPGARLPSSRALATDLGVSRTTAVLAFEQLAAEGYITAKSGSGTYVARQLPDDRLRTKPVAPGHSLRHPPLARGSGAFACVPPTITRLDGPPRAFRIGTPALDRFPIDLWTTLAARRLKRVTRAELDYAPDSFGFLPLRQAIAEHVSRARGTSCVADQVMVVAGAQQGLELVSRLLVDPGDVAWIEDPCYPGARAALLVSGARIQPVQVDAHGLDVDAGARVWSSPRLIYVTPSHQFPLGVSMSLSRRRALLALARSASAWIVEDDYDSEFRYDARPAPSLHGLDTDGRVIYVGSFSKTLFPALRLGYLVVPLDLVDAVRGARRATDLHSPVLEQAVVAEFMAAGHYERHLRRMTVDYRARRDALAEAAARHCGGMLAIRPVATGLHAVADLTGVDAASASREAFARGVEAMPLAWYCLETSPTESLVLGFAAARPELLDDGMARLAAALVAARKAGPRKRP